MAGVAGVGFPIPVFGIGSQPLKTWAIVNADTPLELPLVGQFDPEVAESDGKPIWSKKPGIAGGQPWLKYVGKQNAVLEFTFHCIAVNIIDIYPQSALAKLQALASVDAELGRPPRVYFVYGTKIVEGFITDIPESIPTQTWFKLPLIREVGPVRITITPIPTKTVELSIGTNFITKTEETFFEEVARNQYQDARYCQSLDLINQGVNIGETLEIPRKSDSRVTKLVSVAPAFDDPIEGL